MPPPAVPPPDGDHVPDREHVPDGHGMPDADRVPDPAGSSPVRAGARGSRVLARWLTGVLVGSLLLGGVLWAMGVGRPATEALPTGRDVVVVSVVSLGWADVDARRTPAIAREAGTGALGVQSVAGPGPRTCTTDGWVTLGAGRGAATPADECEQVPSSFPDHESLDDGTVRIDDWDRWLAEADSSSLSPRLGLLADQLAEEGTCVSAADDLSAYGAADSAGVARVGDPSCRVQLVDAVAQTSGDTEPGVLDAVVAEQRAAHPDAVLVVTALSDDAAAPGLRLVTIAGPGVTEGELWSPSTRQVPVVQTTDLTATVLALAGAGGEATPAEVSGAPLGVVPAPDTADAASERLGAATNESAAAAAAQDGTLTALGWTYGVAAALTVALGVGAMRGTGRHRERALRALHWLALGAAALPVASLLQRGLDFWSLFARDDAGWVGALSLVAIASLVAVLSRLAPGGRTALGPLATVLALTVAVIVVDVMAGSGWQLGSYFGLQAIVGGRFYGVGNPMFGLLATATLLVLAVLLACRVWSPRAGALLVGLLGLAVVAVDVAPMWGADFGGLPALLPAVVVLALAATGIRWSWGRALGLTGVTVLALVAVSVADWLRPPAARTHLGDFVQSVLDGEAVGIVTRKAEQNWDVIVSAPLAFLVPVGLVAFTAAVLLPGTAAGALVHGPVARLGLPTALPLALVLCWVIGFAVNDTGAAVAAAGAALLVPAVLGWSARAERAAAPDQPDASSQGRVVG